VYFVSFLLTGFLSYYNLFYVVDWIFSYFIICFVSLGCSSVRAETCREYRSYLIKTLSIVAKQKVLLFTVNTRTVENSTKLVLKLCVFS
jgi:hypothetical protein